jgi:xylan 1,4-beta-xylosidase
VEGGTGGVDALAARGEREISALVWNYSADDVPGPEAEVRLAVSGAPARALLREYRIDERHSNAYAAWKWMGSPQSPSAEQYAELEAAGQLLEIGSPRWINPRELSLRLPRQAVSLVQLSW